MRKIDQYILRAKLEQRLSNDYIDILMQLSDKVVIGLDDFKRTRRKHGNTYHYLLDYKIIHSNTFIIVIDDASESDEMGTTHSFNTLDEAEMALFIIASKSINETGHI
jgi:hypothetical protein